MRCCCASPKFSSPLGSLGGNHPLLNATGHKLPSLLPIRRSGFSLPSSLPLRAHAFSADDLALLDVVAPAARPPDPAVLLQTSALMLSVYLVANFVVPSFVSKYSGFDEAGGEGTKAEDDKPSEEDNRSDG